MNDLTFLDIHNTRGIISTWDSDKVGNQRYPQKNQEMTFRSTEPVLRQISDPDRFYPLFTLRRALETISVYDCLDTTFNSPVRQPCAYDTETRLFPDGRNLTNILNHLRNHHSLEYDKIEEAVKKINPNYKDISFAFLGSKSYLLIREEHLTKSVSVEHVSDGTLRYLLLLAILFNPERGNLVCIDEPEISLHPDMINTMAEAMKQASKNSQLIIATHSPLLLNSFDLDDLLIFEKNAHNETVVNIRDSDEFDGWAGDFLAGQAWLQGLIGGKRW